MAEKGRSFSPEFKQKAVRLLAVSGQTSRVAWEALRPEQLRERRRQVAAPSPTTESDQVRRLGREL